MNKLRCRCASFRVRIGSRVFHALLLFRLRSPADPCFAGTLVGSTMVRKTSSMTKPLPNIGLDPMACLLRAPRCRARSKQATAQPNVRHTEERMGNM
jgi:hypothetical protein